MPDHYEVIVVGAGVMGCATAYHLAKRGRRVLLLEQFAVGHELGSSHGHSRIIRLAYDAPDYVRLAQAAYPLWRALEQESDAALLLQTGGVEFPPPRPPPLHARPPPPSPAAGLVVTAGSWARRLRRRVGLELPLTVSKEQVAFFAPHAPELFEPGRFPIFIHHAISGSAGYGFPIFGLPGVKVAWHGGGP